MLGRQVLNQRNLVAAVRVSALQCCQQLSAGSSSRPAYVSLAIGQHDRDGVVLARSGWDQAQRHGLAGRAPVRRPWRGCTGRGPMLVTPATVVSMACSTCVKCWRLTARERAAGEIEGGPRACAPERTVHAAAARELVSQSAAHVTPDDALDGRSASAIGCALSPAGGSDSAGPGFPGPARHPHRRPSSPAPPGRHAAWTTSVWQGRQSAGSESHGPRGSRSCRRQNLHRASCSAPPRTSTVASR